MNKTVAIVFLLLLYPRSAIMGQQSGQARMSELQCRDLSEAFYLVGPDENLVDGKVCKFSNKTGQPLSNNTILRLVKAGLGEARIVSIIQHEPGNYSLGVDDVIALKKAGVPEEVIAAMSSKMDVGPTPAPVVSGPLAPPGVRELEREGTGAGQQPGTTDPPAISAGQTSPSPSVTDVYQGRGMKDVGLAATAFVPHSSPSDAFGLVALESGYFVTRGSLVGADIDAFFDQSGQDVFITGEYRYFFGKQTNKILPYLGGGAGGNVYHISGEGSSGNLLAEGGGGVRIFVARHVAIDIGYSLYYIHMSGVGFKDSSFSVVSVGFAHVFGRGR